MNAAPGGRNYLSMQPTARFPSMTCAVALAFLTLTQIGTAHAGAPERDSRIAALELRARRLSLQILGALDDARSRGQSQSVACLDQSLMQVDSVLRALAAADGGTPVAPIAQRLAFLSERAQSCGVGAVASLGDRTVVTVVVEAPQPNAEEPRALR
jgi:hypothetical protein